MTIATLDGLTGLPPDPPAPHLTDREIEVLVVWLRANSKEEAAAELFLAPTTVNTHVHRIRAKYAAIGRPAVSKTALFVRAIQDGLVTLSDW